MERDSTPDPHTCDLLLRPRLVLVNDRVRRGAGCAAFVGISVLAVLATCGAAWLCGLL